MKRNPIDAKHVHELLLQALETKRGGIKIYMAAVKAAVNDGLQKEWSKNLVETKVHEELVLALFKKLELDPDMQSPGRRVVAYQDAALLKAIEMAVANGDPDAAQLVATECIVLAETKDHFSRDLTRVLGDQGSVEMSKILAPVHDKIEGEDHHLYHSKARASELWIQAFGLPAVLPPAEKVKKVETAIGASRAEPQRAEML